MPDAKYVFNPSLAIPLELHGSWASVKDRLGVGDVWSNDGTPNSIGDFMNDQRKALGRGVQVLY